MNDHSTVPPDRAERLAEAPMISEAELKARLADGRAYCGGSLAMTEQEANAIMESKWCEEMEALIVAELTSYFSGSAHEGGLPEYQALYIARGILMRAMRRSLIPDIR